ncbi:hypothetical protein HNQ38_000481 [Desulfovibrio intestinalis]|uniref:Uncharacterized protein n=1 Tax=Desulfovibrio intestinalis TaxID=58621 RepID=A0A7W8BYP8_9BACT|nr:hypothetical protein [Desulfovibrio intestinalis]
MCICDGRLAVKQKTKKFNFSYLLYVDMPTLLLPTCEMHEQYPVASQSIVLSKQHTKTARRGVLANRLLPERAAISMSSNTNLHEYPVKHVQILYPIKPKFM